MKKIWYKIEDKIAVRFLRRELNKEYAGKALLLGYEKILQELYAENSSTGELIYTYDYKGKTYQVKSVISIEEISKQEGEE